MDHCASSSLTGGMSALLQASWRQTDLTGRPAQCQADAAWHAICNAAASLQGASQTATGAGRSPMQRVQLRLRLVGLACSGRCAAQSHWPAAAAHGKNMVWAQLPGPFPGWVKLLLLGAGPLHVCHPTCSAPVWLSRQRTCCSPVPCWSGPVRGAAAAAGAGYDGHACGRAACVPAAWSVAKSEGWL